MSHWPALLATIAIVLVAMIAFAEWSRPPDSLGRQRARWRICEPSAYAFTSGIGGRAGSATRRIVVRAGEVVEGRSRRTVGSFPPDATTVDGVFERLGASGVRFRSAVFDGQGGRLVLADDPSGYPVELFQAR